MTRLPDTREDKLGRPFTTRRYRPEDRPALEQMYRGFEPRRAAQGLPPEDEAATRRWLDRTLPRGEQLVVEMDGRLVGHAMLIPMDEEDRAELANFLHQSVRNRGIGTALNRLAIELAREAGYRRVWLSVEPWNRAAVRSYEKAGFRRLPGSLWAPEMEMEAEVGPGPAAGPPPDAGPPASR